MLREPLTLIVAACALVSAGVYAVWANFYALRLGPGTSDVSLWLGSGTIIAGAFLSMRSGSLWDRRPRFALVLSLVLEAAAAAAAMLPGLLWMAVSGLLWEWGATNITAAAGHLAKWGPDGDPRNTQRATAADLFRFLGPVAPQVIAAVALPAETLQLGAAHWRWLMGAALLICAATVTLVAFSKALREVARIIGARAGAGS